MITSDNPGAGHYEHKSALGGGRSSSFYERPKTIDKNSYKPGPAAYDTMNKVNPKTANAPSASWGRMRSPQRNTVKSISPAPGSYNASFDQVNRTAPSFNYKPGTRKHVLRDPVGQDTSPPPNTYSLKPIIGSDGPSKSIYGKFRTIRGDKTPGPGHYESIDQSSPHKSVFGNKTTTRLPSQPMTDGAPVGTYSPRRANRSPSFKMGHEKKMTNLI